MGLVTTNTNGPANFSIESLTLQNGDGPYAGGLYIKAEEVNVTLENTHVLNNIRGGIYINTRGDVSLSGNVISGTINGHGMYLSGYTGSINILNNIITGNSDINGSGGGMFVYTSSKTVTISGNDISYNEAGQAKCGGIHIAAQGVLIENNSITHNIGGGICSFPWWTGYQYNITEIKNNSILHNSDGQGIRFNVISSAQIFFDRLIVTNNIIAYNAAGHTTRGGGINLTGAHIDHKTTLINNTIVGNTSPGDGGGIKIGTRRDDQEYYFYSNVIMNNTGSGLGHDIYIDNDEDEDFIYSPVVMLNNNFDQSPVGFSISEPAYALKLDPSNLNDQAPLFVSAGTDDFHLNTGSPCIDTGSNDASELPVYDREGRARIMDGVVDMGAYEHPGSILPVALFSVDLVEGVIPLTVNYIDESIGSISTWTWSFGDGAFSSEQHPNHTYNEAGSYTVSLTVTGPNGSTLETKTDLIVVELTRPVAVAGPDRAIVQNDITLDGNSSSDVDGTIVSYDWALEHRENSSYNKTASGQFAEITGLYFGFYDVELLVTDDDGLVDTDTMVLSVSEPWDVNNDQTLGLEEVIHILRVITGE